MKKICSLLFPAVALALQVQAQTPISAARSLPIGTSVTITGIVTNGSELGAIRYIQDATGGLPAYSSSTNIPPNNGAITALNAGDSVVVTGVLKNYNNLLELDPVTSLEVIATGKPLPAPVVVSAANMSTVFAEQYEGQLVTITDVTSITTTSGGAFATFAGNTTYRINNIQGRDLRIAASSSGPDGVVGKPRPVGTFDITGLMGQYMANYQLQPRLYSDFDLGATPNIISAISAANITTTSLDIVFETSNPATVTINYGTTPAMGQSATSSNSTANHSVSITGLQPATVYYTQITTTNAAGSITSDIVPVITASTSTGDIKVYFNRPVATQFALPNNNAVYLNQTMDDSLIAYINRAKYSLDVAIYSFGISSIATAINNAKARGVDVRVIGDASTTSNALTVLDASVPRILRDDQAIMHNKILIIDAVSADANDPYVLMGSTNFTWGQINDDPNSIILIQDQSLAKVYTMEFNEIWGSETTTPGTPKFGNAKSDNTPHQVMVNGKLIEVYFSPSDNVQNKLIQTINSANYDLAFATMLNTRVEIANAIKEKLTINENVAFCAGGIMNDTVGASTPWNIIKSVMGNRLQKYNGTHIMHHKYIMADASAPQSDPQIFVGSHNWSNAANTNNDENTLIIHDYEIVNQFYQEWAQRMIDQNANIMICNYALVGVEEEIVKNTMLVYPNPTQGEFFVSLSAPVTKPVVVRVIDMTGRVVSEQVISAAQWAAPVSVRTANLPGGMYGVQLTGDGVNAVSRIVVQ